MLSAAEPHIFFFFFFVMQKVVSFGPVYWKYSEKHTLEEKNITYQQFPYCETTEDDIADLELQ